VTLVKKNTQFSIDEPQLYRKNHPIWGGRAMQRSKFLVMVSCSLLLAASSLRVEAQVPQYTVSVMASPSGEERGILALDINVKGAVPATLTASGAQPVGFVWKAGRATVLPALGGTCSLGKGINSLGHVAGAACLGGNAVRHATIWRHNRPSDIDTFGGTGSEALQVNRSDAAIGDYTLSDASVHGFLWQSGEWLDLGNLGGSATLPSELNDSGVVTGQSDIGNELDSIYGIPHFHGFLWNAGVLTDFGSIFGADFNYGNAINAAGQVVGSADLAGDTEAHAILWDQGTVQDLGAAFAGTVTFALDINNHSEIVGGLGSFDPFPEDGPPANVIGCPCFGLIWRNGQPLFLDGLVPSGWHILIATDINDRGQIVAEGQLNGGALRRLLLAPAKGKKAATSSAIAVAPRSSAVAGSGPRRIRRMASGEIIVE
jgi:probable HAF family extracellular repeat protein